MFRPGYYVIVSHYRARAVTWVFAVQNGGVNMTVLPSDVTYAQTLWGGRAVTWSAAPDFAVQTGGYNDRVVK